jgi:hypothetical protein
MIDWTPHPVLAVPTREQLIALAARDGEEAVVQLWKDRETAIRMEQEDPLNYGHRLDCWKDADAMLDDLLLLVVFGGNGSGKSWYGAWKGINLMLDKPGAKVLWLHESESTSVDVQQSAVYRYLPREYREVQVRRTRTTNINYTVKNGFSDNKFVLPNGSIGKFGSYKQEVGDYEGTGWDLIVADENLPLAWLRTLLIRLPRCGGKMLWTFTPIKGVTPAIAEIVKGAVTVESLPAPLLAPDKVHVDDCPPGHMPYKQRPMRDGAMILYFHSSMNPYGGYDDLVRILKTMDAVDIERRAYGWARNNVRQLIRTFSAAHIIPPDRVPTTAVSRYHFADPAGARNMFMLWVAVDAAGRHFIYREWPDVSGFGEWAVASETDRRWDGEPGPAQESLGYGVIEYKRIILEAEGNRYDPAAETWDFGGEEIEERYIDPRSGKAAAMSERDGGSSLIDRMADEQEGRKGTVIGPEIIFHPASGVREDEGIQAILDLLAYDKSQPVTALLNEPRLYISSACQNIIWALQNYTGHDGEKAACKDPVDLVRYMSLAELEYLPDTGLPTSTIRTY